MQRRIFHSMVVVQLLLLFGSAALLYYGDRLSDLQGFGWLLLLFLVLLGLSFWLSGWVTKKTVTPLLNLKLEELEQQDISVELWPLATRVIEENRRIQKRLQKQYATLKRQYEKQDRTRRDFTANVSHELKTPLTSISGYAEIIRDGIAREEDVERFAGKIYDETQRLIVLVGDILKLSQLDEGHQVRMERVEIDLYAACEQVILRLQSAAKARQISFLLEGQHLTIVGVEQIVDEIIFNLCDNAIKYNRQGGQVRVSVTPRGDRVCLMVADEGIGISREEQERVFERFYRVDRSHSKEIGGTGLGLSIVKHGAAYHEAGIEMESELGVGTRFQILFPSHQELEPPMGGKASQVV